MHPHTINLECLWKRVRKWAEENGHEHNNHGVQGVGAL